MELYGLAQIVLIKKTEGYEILLFNSSSAFIAIV